MAERVDSPGRRAAGEMGVRFDDYLKDSGIATSFRIIFLEIVQKEIPED